MNLPTPEYLVQSQQIGLNCTNWIRLAKEPVREIPDEPDDPEIRPDLAPESLPDLDPEIPDVPTPEIFPDLDQPEISPSPEF